MNSSGDERVKVGVENFGFEYTNFGSCHHRMSIDGIGCRCKRGIRWSRRWRRTIGRG